MPLVSIIEEITNGGTPLRHNLSEGEIPFLTAEHVFDFRINYASEKRITLEHHLVDMPRTRLKQNDIVIAIKGKVGNAAVVDNPPHEANINQDVGLFRLKDGVNPYYVVGFLNSIIGKAFVEQISTGQINPFLGLGNLKTIKIPIFETELMNELGEHLKLKLNSAYKIAQQSKQLLEIAKRAVEMAIEDSEAAAIDWIDENLASGV